MTKKLVQAKTLTAHPNALAAGGTSTGAVLLIVLLAALGITITPVVAGVIVGAASTLILLIGKKGIRGLIRMVWRGDDDRQSP